MLDKQGVLDKVVDYLSQENITKSQNNRGNCLYRRSDGSRCFIGVLIPDDLYTPEMENRSVDDNIVFNVLTTVIDRTEVDKYFLQALQCVHDYCSPALESNWLPLVKERLKVFAIKNNLEYKGN